MKIISELLNNIQQELNAPKGQRNDFAQFNYRSCEDILTAVKPLLNGAILLLNDTIEVHNGNTYLKATATLILDDNKIECSAYAKEPPQAKPKMDESQTTGSTSSYARKYALNGLFAIDNEKDADTQDNTQTNNYQPNNFIDDESKEWLDIDKTPKVLDQCHKYHQEGLTPKQVVARLRAKFKVSRETATFIEGELT